MPNYEYRCRDCNRRFKKNQASGEEPITTCPKCEGVLVRTIFPPGFILTKGKSSKKVRTMQVGGKTIYLHQAKEGHWEQGGIN